MTKSSKRPSDSASAPVEAALDQPHHDGSALYVPQQTAALDETVAVLLRVPSAARATKSIALRWVYNGEPRFSQAVLHSEDAHETWWRAELQLHNPVTCYRWLLDYGEHGYSWLNGTGLHTRDIPDSADFRLTAFAAPPAWSRAAVIYQIFPDRFARSAHSPSELPAWARPAGWTDAVVHQGEDTPRQYYGGDLKGIEDRLDYLADLGVDVVYLTPFFPASSNHRYDASSFDRVDPLLGGDAALASLSAALHRRGMRLLGDLTTNHSGSAHAWFQRALADAQAPEAGYYYFSNHPHDYVAWFAVPSLPKLNLGSLALRKALVEGSDSVVAKWLKAPYSLDGWRVDVANMTGRQAADDYNQQVARTMRATMAEQNADTFLVGEHFHDPSADASGDGWHAVMNYAAFTRPLWAWLNDPAHGLSFLGVPLAVPSLPAEQAVATMREFSAQVPWRTTAHNVNLLGSHDTARPRTIMGSDARLAVAAGILFTYPGVPMLFMGDELAMSADNGEHARTPMPWQDPTRLEVPMRDIYRTLIALRRAQPALRDGGLRWVHCAGDVISYLRETKEQRLLVVASRAPHAGIRLPPQLATSSPRSLYGGAPLRVHAGALEVPGHGPSFDVWEL